MWGDLRNGRDGPWGWAKGSPPCGGACRAGCYPVPGWPFDRREAPPRGVGRAAGGAPTPRPRSDARSALHRGAGGQCLNGEHDSRNRAESRSLTARPEVRAKGVARESCEFRLAGRGSGPGSTRSDQILWTHGHGRDSPSPQRVSRGYYGASPARSGEVCGPRLGVGCLCSQEGEGGGAAGRTRSRDQRAGDAWRLIFPKARITESSDVSASRASSANQPTSLASLCATAPTVLARSRKRTSK